MEHNQIPRTLDNLERCRTMIIFMASTTATGFRQRPSAEGRETILSRWEGTWGTRGFISEPKQAPALTNRSGPKTRQRTRSMYAVAYQRFHSIRMCSANPCVGARRESGLWKRGQVEMGRIAQVYVPRNTSRLVSIDRRLQASHVPSEDMAAA